MNKENLVNLKVLNEIKNIHKEFEKNYPFEHISIENFFNEQYLKKVKEEIKKEEFYLEDHDLYQFSRTTDLKNTKNKILQEFRKYIFSKEFTQIISKITNTKIKENIGDLHALKLENTNYLLCHDDQVQNRKIAFIIQLSENFSTNDGGSLDLFESNSKFEPIKIVKSITPKFNSFNMFKISNKSFHQISEVKTNKKIRLSISGWYYEK